jgi:hypothetical protein
MSSFILNVLFNVHYLICLFSFLKPYVLSAQVNILTHSIERKQACLTAKFYRRIKHMFDNSDAFP